MEGAAVDGSCPSVEAHTICNGSGRVNKARVWQLRGRIQVCVCGESKAEGRDCACMVRVRMSLNYGGSVVRRFVVACRGASPATLHGHMAAIQPQRASSNVHASTLCESPRSSPQHFPLSVVLPSRSAMDVLLFLSSICPAPAKWLLPSHNHPFLPLLPLLPFLPFLPFLPSSTRCN